MESGASSVLIPLLNPNEPEAHIISLSVQEGQHVVTGELLCTLETTKSTAEVTAERDGFVIGLNYRQGQMALAGDVLCYLAESPDWKLEIHLEPLVESSEFPPDTGKPAGLRITQPALKLARQVNLDLSSLPVGPLITEDFIRLNLLESKPPQVTESRLDPRSLIIYGGGGHGKSLIELIRATGSYHLHGIVDDGLVKDNAVLGVPVLGGREVLHDLVSGGIRLGANAVGGIGNIQVRIKVFDLLAQAGFACPTLIHPSAFLEASAQLSAGVQVMPLAYIGSEARIGFGVIVNTSAVVSHDCVLGDYTNISPGALLAGEVKTGKGVLIGMGATVNLGVTIGDGARIGNGATIKADIPAAGIVRAGTIWPE